MTAVALAGYGIFAPADPTPEDRDRSRLLVALAWTSARRSIGRIVGRDLVSDPGWDILLDLYVNHMQARPVFVCGLCLAAQVPQTTALRWIATLEKRGLVDRAPDANDRRRSFVRLTEAGLDRMREALDASSDSDRRLGIGRLQTIQ